MSRNEQNKRKPDDIFENSKSDSTDDDFIERLNSTTTIAKPATRDGMLEYYNSGMSQAKANPKALAEDTRPAAPEQNGDNSKTPASSKTRTACNPYINAI
jgi:hypothetical protein